MTTRAADRPSYRDQYEELELLYRESRAFLALIERNEKRSEQERRLKAQRLRVLRVARDTLYDLARQEGGATLIQPADYAA